MAVAPGAIPAAGPEWSRPRLLAILATTALAAAILVGAIVYALVLAVAGLDAARPGTGTGGPPGVLALDTAPGLAHGAARRDEIAAAPMLDVPRTAMFPADLATSIPVTLEIPTGITPGPAQILTGFPPTPEGAIGQLAQIDQAALQAMSPGTAEEIYRAWALPGGIGPERWWITRSVQAFLTSSAMGEALEPSAWVEIDPAAALIKGTDGPDWLIACVLMKVKATYRQEAQIAFGHCERLMWVGGRWMIAPGLPPAPAPSTWPGTEFANLAGWRPWATAPD